MNTRFMRYLQLSIVFLDLLTLNVILFTARYFFDRHAIAGEYNAYNYLSIFLNVIWAGVALLRNIYGTKYLLSFEAFSRRSIQGFVYFLAISILYLFFFRQFGISRGFLLVVLISFPALILINRFLFFIVYEYYKRKDYILDKVVIIGYNDISKRLIQNLEEDGFNKEIVGICDEYYNVNELSHYPILSSISNVFDVCKQFGITEVYSSIAPEQNPEIYKFIELADKNCIRFRIVPDISFFVKRKVHINYINNLPVLSLRNEPLEELTNRINKRIFDVVVSVLAIVFFLSWLVPIIGLCIWYESRGPVFFTQLRTGKGNRTFQCFKFRSMRPNNDTDAKQAKRDDDRFTRIGKFIRKTNLDEMPQFINVLLGHMSVIGPRPHPVTFFSMIHPEDDHMHLEDNYMIRHFVKPGVSGWAQVNGYRGEIEKSDQLKKRIEHDIWYSENWTLLLDIRIMFMTVMNTVRGEKNAF